MPTAQDDDWELLQAGQRAQVMKGGKLQFGTEVVAAADGSIAGLLGASPGASTAVPIMLDVLQRCFPEQYGGVGAEAAGAHPDARREAERGSGRGTRASMAATAKTLDLTA